MSAKSFHQGTHFLSSDRPDVGNEPARLLTKKRTAERLAVSTRTVDRLVARGILEKLFVGSMPRFRERDVDALVQHGG